jgi:hypothetical protein
LGAQSEPLAIIEVLDPKKLHLGPQNGPRSLGTEKLLKIVSCQKTCFEPVGIGGWPPISTWINPPSLGSNGLHCVEFSGGEGKAFVESES